MNELEILQYINEIGFLLLKHGAEIYRVEESLTRMCQGCQFTNIEVFAVPTYFTITLTLHDGTIYNSSRRSLMNRIHLDHLYSLNHLVRQISNQSIPLENIQPEIEKIKNQKLNFPLILIGYILSAGMFCIFYGGNAKDTIISAFIGFILYFFIYLMEILAVNGIVRTILSSMIIATIAILSNKIGIINSQQAVITGTTMLLVPGVAMTNSLRDIIAGDYLSGMIRMVESILIASSIAIGVGIMMMLLGGIQ